MADPGIRTVNLDPSDAPAIEVLAHVDLGNGARALRRQPLEIFVQRLLGLAGLDPSGVADLSQRLNDEISRAMGAEGDLRLAIQAGSQQQGVAIADLANRLAAEIVRASGIEAGLRTDLVAEIARAVAADGQIDGRVDIIESRVQARTNLSGVAITDQAGHVFLRLTSTGTKLPGLMTRVRRNSGEGAAITDERGNSLITIGRREIRHPAIRALRWEARRAGLGFGLTMEQATPWSIALSLADCLQIMIYGQSKSAGVLAGPTVSTAPLAYADRFNGGVRTQDSGADPVATHASLTGLAEEDYNSYYFESPAAACAMMIAQLLRDENGIDILAQGPRLLLSCPGETAKSLAELSSGAWIQRVYDDITYGQSLSAAAGRTVNLGALGWTQGESDYSASTDPTAWYNGVKSLRTNVETRANTASGLTRTLPMFLTQCSMHLAYGQATPGIALKQLALADEDPFCFVTPEHFLNYGSDHIHFTAASSLHLGAFYGLAIKRAAFDGVKVKPLVPGRVERNGPTVVLHFPNALGGLVFDTTTCPNPGNYGFTLVASDGTDIPIIAVRLVGPNTVVVRAATAIPAGAKVRHAWIGDGYRGLGNLRDRQGDDLFFDAYGRQMPMHRFAPIFERTAA